jgi:hypothetical protein
MNAPLASATIDGFEFKESLREVEPVPCLIGIYGPSGSGKTYSALRLATGMQRVTGGEIWVIDSEAKRAKHYLYDKELNPRGFHFRHMEITAPFSPKKYLAAIRFCKQQGASIVITDSMTHEHSGEGGYLQIVDKWLEKKYPGDQAKQDANYWRAFNSSGASEERKALNDGILHMGINAIFCYRGNDKQKPAGNGQMQKTGMQPETTSSLIYEMVQCFLLMPGSDGKPVFRPETNAEKLMVKTPEQFRGWFTDGMQLNEDVGQKIATWASGKKSSTTTEPKSEATQQPYIHTGHEDLDKVANEGFGDDFSLSSDQPETLTNRQEMLRVLKLYQNGKWIQNENDQNKCDAIIFELDRDKNYDADQKKWGYAVKFLNYLEGRIPAEFHEQHFTFETA